jgi:hypothetical protein
MNSIAKGINVNDNFKAFTKAISSSITIINNNHTEIIPVTKINGVTNEIKQNESKLIDIVGVGIINSILGDMSTAINQIAQINKDIQVTPNQVKCGSQNILKLISS